MFEFRHECGAVHAKALVLDGVERTDEITDDHIHIVKGVLPIVHFEFD